MPHVEQDGATLWWTAVGAGPPLLMIQGLGYPSDAWSRVVPGLSTSFRLLLFDNRGAGRTGVPAEPFTIATMADDAHAVLRAAGEESAHVFGASLGGIVAQELALRHPGAVRSLVLGCTSPGGPDAIPSEDAAQAFLTARADMTPREAAEAAVPLVYADTTPRELIQEDIDLRMEHPTGPEGYAAQLRAVFGYGGAQPRLGAVDVPTLILHGTQDRLIPPTNATLLATAIRGARVEWLPGAGHVFTTDATERTVEVVSAFLKEVSA